MTLEEKKRALEHYFTRQLHYMGRFDDNATKITFLHYCFGAIDMMVSVSSTEEFKALEELWDEWRPKLEAEAYGL